MTADAPVSSAAGAGAEAGPRPELSVVIASINGLPYPLACLDALAGQRGDARLEVIVADCTGPATVAAIRERHPWVRLVISDERRSVPWLRAAGVAEARGPLVAITEDHCVPRPGWVRAAIDAPARTGWAAAGGGVDNGATERAIDWAVYFCEYADLMAPVATGPAPAIPGMNAVYDLDRLGPAQEALTAGLWENVIHERIRQAGHTIGLDAAMTIDHCKHFTISGFTSERFHYSRAFAGNRVAGAGRAERLTWAARSLALPPVILARVVRAALSRRRHLGWLVRTAHLLVFFSVVWSVGELCGYLTGPGDSLTRIR